MKRALALKQLEKLKKHLKDLRLAAKGWNAPWQSLISIMLSARTRDEVTIIVCEKLFKKYKSAKELAKAKISEVENFIRPVNYYKTKAKNVIGCAKMINEKYHGNPPIDFEKLIELPGIGRKTANVFLSEMGKDAIGVDTHVSQLAQKLKWTKNTKPEKIEADLKKLFPQNKWTEINETLVLFGRSHRGKKQDELLSKIFDSELNTLREIFNKHDPIEIYFGKDVNFDEYNPEIKEAMKAFKKSESVKDFTSKLHLIFIHFFGKDIAGLKSKYEKLAKEVYNFLSCA